MTDSQELIEQTIATSSILLAVAGKIYNGPTEECIFDLQKWINHPCSKENKYGIFLFTQFVYASPVYTYIKRYTNMYIIEALSSILK